MRPRRAIDIQSLFFYVFFSLPLFYIFDHPVLSRTIRFSVLFGLLLLIFCIQPTRRIFWRNLSRLNRFIKIALGVLLALLMISTVFAHNDVRTALFGLNPEYFGFVSWVSLLALAVLFYDRLTELLTSKVTLLLSIIVISASLAFSYFEILHGLRMPGLILQATSMGMYAVFTSVVGFWHLRLSSSKRIKWLSIALIALSFAAVMLTQSRITTVTFIGALGVIAVHAFLSESKHSFRAWLAVALLIAASLIPRLSATYFARFQTDSVNGGISYRLQLYRLTTNDILRDNVVLGNGPSTLPESINNESAVPQDIRLSLQVGDAFFSSHNMYLDIGYSFGLAASLIVLGLTAAALWHGLFRPQQGWELGLLFVVLVMNALVNVTSLELTPWYFVLLLGIVGHYESRKNA